MVTSKSLSASGSIRRVPPYPPRMCQRPIFLTKQIPGEPSPHRSVQQIDLVPALSLLLGLPIPFNNLGTVIPELFWRDSLESIYSKPLGINAGQVHAYLDAYRNSPSGGELDSVWDDLEASWTRFTPASQRTGQKRQSNSPVWHWKPTARSGRDLTLCS